MCVCVCVCVCKCVGEVYVCVCTQVQVIHMSEHAYKGLLNITECISHIINSCHNKCSKLLVSRYSEYSQFFYFLAKSSKV